MTDKDIKEAVETDIISSLQGKHILTLKELGKLYLTIAEMEGMPKDKVAPELPKTATGLDQFSGGVYIQAIRDANIYNFARQECILAYAKREQELLERIRSLEIQSNDLADGVTALSKAICPDGSITLVAELVDFAKDLQHDYKVVSEFGEQELKNQDGIYYYCGKMTDSSAGNPGQWAVMLCHSDEPGKVKYHHQLCVSKRLELPSIKEIETIVFDKMGDAVFACDIHAEDIAQAIHARLEKGLTNE